MQSLNSFYELVRNYAHNKLHYRNSYLSYGLLLILKDNNKKRGRSSNVLGI